MNFSLNVKSSSIVHTLLSNCVKLLGKVQKLLIQLLGNFQANSLVSPKFYTVRKKFTGPPVPPVPTNLKSDSQLSRVMVELLLDHNADVDVENVGEMLLCRKSPFNIFTRLTLLSYSYSIYIIAFRQQLVFRSFTFPFKRATAQSILRLLTATCKLWSSFLKGAIVILRYCQWSIVGSQQAILNNSHQ